MELQQRHGLNIRHGQTDSIQQYLGLESTDMDDSARKKSRKKSKKCWPKRVVQATRFSFAFLLIALTGWKAFSKWSSEEKYILGVYLYNSEFNDKLNRWWYSFLPVADASNRTLVLPWFNVHKGYQRHLGKYDYESYEVFFNTNAVTTTLPAMTLNNYMNEFGQRADLAVFSTEYASELFGIQCENWQFLHGKRTLDVFGMNFAVEAVLCAPNGKSYYPDVDKLFRLMEPYQTVIIFGFDSHNNYGSHLRVSSLTKERQDKLRASVELAPYIQERASQFLRDHCPEQPVAAIHWRAEFSPPEDLIKTIHAWIPTLSPPPACVFLATEEMDETVVDRIAKSIHVPLFRYDPRSESESDVRLRKPGVVAVLDQSICIEADYFLGNQQSTFTESIVGHRTRMGKPFQHFHKVVLPDQ